MWGAGYPVQASFVPPGGAANPFVPAQHAWAQQQQQGRFSYGAQQAVQAAYGQSSLTYQPLQQMLSSGTTTTKHAGEEKYIAFSEGNDTEEFVIQTLSGEFTVKGENHGRPFYQKMPVRAGTPPPEVFVYYWDGRDGPSFEGWWFGKAVGGNEVWSHCPEKAMLPPLKGWKIPFQGPARNTFIMMPRSEKLKRENQERASRVKVLEQGASNVINAAQKAVDEAKVVCEKDHGSLDPTILKEVEASLKPHLQALMDQLKNVESAGLGDATKQLESKIRRTHVQATDAISKIKVLVPQIMRVQQEKQSEQRDEKLLKEMLTSITEKFHAAEDLAEKAEITSAMIEHAGEDLVEAQKAAQQTEESAKQAAAAVKEALTAIGLKLAMLKQFESDQGRLKATDALGTFREKLRVANQKLVPFLAAQDTFKAQAEAKYLADELEAKLAPAEVEVDKAEQVAEPLLSFAEAALAAGQAAAEATATPKAKASSSKEKDKKSETSKEKIATLNQLPKAEVVAQAAQNAQEAAVSLQGVVKLLETKRSDQQVLFSAPMKKVLEKAENRVKNAQRKLERIKVAQKELKERETSIALVSDVQEKMESVEKALNLAKEAVAACQGDEQEMLKVATKEVSTAKVALSMRLLEVKRFTAEAGIQAQRSLQEHQQSLQASLAEIEALKKKAAENKEVSKRKEAQRKVEEAEDRAHQAEKSAADIFDESRIASMTAMEIREAGDKNQQAFKGTMEAVRAAQTMITTLQIEAKNKENATTLTHDYAKLQARLRQAEAAVAHCAVLPPAVQAQLQLKAHIDEVESKVKDSEAKVEIAEKMAMEAEKNPLPAEETKGDAKTSGAGVPAPKAFPSKAMPCKGKAFGKGEAKGEPEATGGPVEKAKAAVEVANLELKMVMRYLEAQAKAERIPEEDMNILKGRIEAAKARVDAASGLLEKAVEKRASLALLGDADKKVFEAEKAVEAAAELAVPLQELMASEEKKPVKAQGGKTSEEQDGKEAEDKDQEGEKKEEKDAEKMDEKDEENDEEGKKKKDKKEEKETTDAQGQEKKGEDGEDPKDGKGKGDEDTKEEMKEEMKEEKEEKEPVKEETEEDGEGKTEPSPLEEALAAMNNAAQVASRQLSSAKTTLAVKRISAKRLPGNAPATCLEQLDALQKRLDAAMKRLAEVRRGSTDRQYAKARKAMAQSIEQAEAKVEASKEAFQALMDLPEEADLPKMQQVLQSAAAAQSEATAAIQAARVPLVERLQKAKADGVTTDTSEVLKEFQEMFAKLAPLQSKLDEQRREANDKEHKFVASLLMQEATEMLKEVDGKLARLNEVALPLTKGEELQPLARLGQLLEALRHHASSASKTHATLWGELAKASGGEGGHIIPKGITDALKSLQPELPDLADLLGATEEDAQMLAAGLARMDPEEAAKEDGGISEQKFIEHMKVRYLCVAVVTVTSELEVGSNTVRKLEVNEVLDALGEATRESKSGLERVECKAQQDGAQGFVTIAGSGGTTYLEVYTPFMERVRAAEEALADSHESVSSTVHYLKQKHDELKSTRGSLALNELKQKLQDLRVQATRAQVQYSDVKHKVTEAKNRHDRQLEAHKKRRQTAAEKLAADTITGEASAMVDELIAKATNACNAASSILNVTTSDTPSSTISLQALEQVEKDLLAVVEACAEGEGKIMKTVEKEIRNASKGPLVDARRMMFRLKVKLAPLPNNCKKHLKTIQEKKLMMVEDVQRMVADLLREHARKNNLSADALYEQLRKVPDHADGAGAVNGNADGDANSDRTAEADGAIPIESLRGFLQSVKEMASAELDIALQGFEAGISRFAFFDLVEEYRKCVKEVAVTATIEVKSSITRKLEIDEVVQVLGQPTIEEGSGLLRAPCRILRDNIEGWVTLNGSQGTAYLKRVAKPYYLCEEETSLLDSCASSGQQVSTARKGERLEVLEGPRLETTTEVTRARGRATKDGQVGWVLFKDHSGRCFFELQDLLICRGGVALTDNFDIGACKAIRKLEVGETLQSLEEPRQDESRSLTRIKVRALNDGKEGWATSQGNQGTLYVVETNKHFTCAESVDLEASPGKALRRLEVGEGFELLQDPTVELRQGKSFARGRCSSGQPGEGWFAITGNVQPWTHREELSAKTLSTDVQS